MAAAPNSLLLLLVLALYAITISATVTTRTECAASSTLGLTPCITLTAECGTSTQSDHVGVVLFFQGNQNNPFYSGDVSTQNPTACSNNFTIPSSPCSTHTVCMTFANAQIHSDFFYGCPTITLTCGPLSFSRPLQCISGGIDCSPYSTCGSCTNNTACGWCDVTQKCVPGNSGGPLCGDCSSPSMPAGLCAWSYGTCPISQEDYEKALSTISSLQQELSDADLLATRTQTQLDSAESARLSHTQVFGVSVACLVLGALFTLVVVKRHVLLRSCRKRSTMESAWHQMSDTTNVETSA